MAVEDSDKHARLFPCLAILRYTVVTVVTVLAAVVIVMVIAVSVRPDNVSVSVIQGRVRTTDLWINTTTTATNYVDAEATTTATAKAGYRGGGPRGSCIGGRGGAALSSCSGRGSGDAFDPYYTRGGGGIYNRRLPTTTTVYIPVGSLSLEVALSMDNQSGRGTIYCWNINVTFYVGGTSSTEAKMKIGMFILPFNFQVKPQTSHKISRLLPAEVKNETVLKYIADNYGGEYSFTGTVEVSMNTSSGVTKIGHHTTPRIVNLVCSPVIFSVYAATATGTSVQCIKSN